MYTNADKYLDVLAQLVAYGLLLLLAQPVVFVLEFYVDFYAV